LEVLVEAGELNDALDDGVKTLAEFLGDRLKVEVRESAGTLAMTLPDDLVGARRRIRLLLKKFLHKQGLDEFRVITGVDGRFIVKRRKPKP